MLDVGAQYLPFQSLVCLSPDPYPTLKMSVRLMVPLYVGVCYFDHDSAAKQSLRGETYPSESNLRARATPRMRPYGSTKP